LLEFCIECGAELRHEHAAIQAAEGLSYPLMKPADMFFWQIGYEAAAGTAEASTFLRMNAAFMSGVKKATLL
jgi:hypothetical protein